MPEDLLTAQHSETAAARGAHRGQEDTDVIVLLFPITKRQKLCKCSSIAKWIHKMWSTCTTEYYLAIKRN